MKCLRCGAGPEWLSDDKAPSRPAKVTEWHPYSARSGYVHELKCESCGTVKPYGEPSVGWWKRYDYSEARTHRRCPRCSPRQPGADDAS